MDPASFRDPSGFVFRRDGVLYRQIQRSAAGDWDAYVSSGLHASLVADGLIVEHADASLDLAVLPDAAAVIQPRALDFISYPYEWCFSQLKEAALLTLEIQSRALEAGFRLRDASAYNLQFDAGRPILIDSLSFEPSPMTEPWPAYRQFCEHFIAPLALMAHRDVRCGLMLREFTDGIPIDLAATLLPGRTRLNLGLTAHVHLHARAQRRAAKEPAAPTNGKRNVSATGQLALLDSLRRTVEGLRYEPSSGWIDYAGATSYSEAGTASKAAIVRDMLAAAAGRTAWDIGANVGVYSGMAADAEYRVIAFDQDAASVEAHWRRLRPDDRATVLPLVMDLSNPSPALGWALEERASILDRGEPDVVMALALVHHLAIGNNVPLPRVAELFGRMARHAIVEFVPKEDPMVQHLLASRNDIFDGYTIEGFREAFSGPFTIVREAPIDDSPRTVFLLERR